MNFDIGYQIILPMIQKTTELTHSYGWAIILITIAVRILVSPLVAQTTISMRRMSKLQPQMKALQARYKDNPEQLQKKLMEFYSKNKVNPMGGCLPMLIQMPLILALYWTFNGPPFTDKSLDVKVTVVSADKAQSISKAESGPNSIYVSKKNVAAKVVVFPGNSTIVAGNDLTFGTRASEGKLAADFTPHWRMILPESHEPIEARPAAQNTITEKGKAWIDTNGHAFFPAVGEYHVLAVIPGVAKNDSFAFISGLGKVATGINLLKPANFDLLFLIVLFGGSMALSQKFTMPTVQKKEGQELDEQQIIQQQTANTMPFVSMIMFAFFPIPAGIYLYLDVANIIQTFQTWLITRMPEPEFVDPNDPAEGNGPIGPDPTGPKNPKPSQAGAREVGRDVQIIDVDTKNVENKSGQAKKKNKRKKK